MDGRDYRRIVLSAMHVVLKPAGFRKKQILFASERNDVVLFVQLQSSSRTTKDLLVVTVNLGIFSKTIAQAVGNTHQPNILEGHWQERIGSFTPKGLDKWWEIHNEQEADSAGLEIAELLTNVTLPKMAALDSTEKLVEFWRSTNNSVLESFLYRKYFQGLANKLD
jgi:hypothetical protein